MVIEIQLFYQLKRRYFRQFWSYIQWGIIVPSWLTLTIYVWRHQEIKRIGALFQQTHGYVYMSLRMATYVNDLLTFLLGFCCFFVTMRLLRFSRYNEHLSLYGDTIKHGCQELFFWTLLFFIIFVAFIFLFYLLFISKIKACSSLLQTTLMLVDMVLMKFDASDLSSADALFGPLYLALFLCFVVVVGITMFISILQRSFRVVRMRRKRRTTEDDDHEMFAYMWDRFRRWSG